jgi:PAS domain S-box-containing protein
MSTKPQQLSERWPDDYARLFEAYTERPSDDVLRQAMSLGHSLLENGVPPCDVAAAHMACVSRLCERAAGGISEGVRTTGSLFIELMRLYSTPQQHQPEVNARSARSTQPLKHAVAELGKAQHALRHSEEDFRALAENARDAILIGDGDGRYVYANQQAAALTGYSVEELIATVTMEQLIAPGEFDKVQEHCQTRLAGNRLMEQYETVIVRKDGHRTPVEVMAADTLWQDEPVVLGILRDITECKRVEETLRTDAARFRLMLDQIPAVVWTTDTELRFTSSLATGLRSLGLEPNEVVGLSLFDYFRTDDAEYLPIAMHRRALQGEPGTYEDAWENNAYQSHVEPLRDDDGQIVGVVGVALDITERKQAEEALRRAHAELERRVEERTADLKAANRRLQAEIAERQRIEEALRRSEETARVLLDASPAAGILIDVEGHILALNETCARPLGRRPEALIGEYVFDVLPPEVARGRKAHTLKVIRTGQPLRFEDEHRGRIFESHVHPVFDSQGLVERVAVFGHDITERRRAEEALRESEAKYRQLFETVSDALVVFDAETRKFLEVNDAAVRLYGYSREEFLKLRHPDITAEPEKSSASIRQTLASELARIPLRYHKKKDGTLFPVEISASAFTLGNRRVLCGVIRDITERKRAEQAARAERDHLERIIDGTPAIVCGIAPDGMTTFVNPAGERITGYKAEELVARNWWQVFYPGEEQRQVEQLLRALERGDLRDYEMVLTARTGEKRTISWSSIKRFDESGKLIEVIGFGTDVTERERAEKVLREKTEILENVLTHIPHSVFWKDRDSVYLGCNQNFAREAGVASPQDIVGKTDYDLPWSAEQSDFYTQCDRQVISTGRPLANIEEPLLRADGSEAVVLTSKTPLRDLDGAVIGVLGIYADITERKRVEETLQRQALVFDNIYDGVIVVDPQERISDWNPAAERMFGYPKAAILGQSSEVLNRPDEAADVTRSIREGLAQNGRWSGQVRFVRADGREGFCEVVSVPLCDPAGRVIGRVSVNRDITDRTRAEEEARHRRAELAHVSRLATMGEMASGLAHELNQPLSAILYYARGCGRRLRAGGWDFDEVLGVIEKVAVQAERAGAIIDRLRAFVRKRRPQLSPLDINLVVREAVSFAEHEARENGVNINLQLCTTPRPVLADIIQIEQVILNLLRNAIEAMGETEPGNRRLTLQTSNAGSDAVMCAVGDTGCGFSAETASQLFDAFYTSKPDGMGMGLPISRSIIESHGGRLWATPNLSGGATFRFTLPVYREG